MEWSPDLSLYPKYLHTRIARGRGIGTGEAYQPWIKIHDFSSDGTSSRARGIITHRVHHLLSSLETIYFYLLESRTTIVDIREQFPILELPRTLGYCAQLGVRHAYRGHYPEPFTIDFLITINDGGGVRHIARSIKTAEDSNDEVKLTRLAVEKLWCHYHGIDYRLIDTSKFSEQMLQVLRYVRGWHKDRYIPDHKKIQEFTQIFLDLYVRNVPLHKLLAQVAAITTGSGYETINTFKYACWSKLIPISLSSRLTLNDIAVLERT